MAHQRSCPTIWEVSDDLWETIKILLDKYDPPASTGRPRVAIAPIVGDGEKNVWTRRLGLRGKRRVPGNRQRRNRQCQKDQSLVGLHFFLSTRALSFAH